MSFHPLMPYGEGFHRSDRVLLHKGEPFAYTPERAAQLEEICGRYPPERRKSAVLAALYLVQEQQGYLTANALRHVAQFLRITPAEVEDVSSYYVMCFKAPVGKFVLQVCRTLSCALAGRAGHRVAQRSWAQGGDRSVRHVHADGVRMSRRVIARR
jgi:NADH-quinone oxidoreductase subunit E